MSEPVHPQTGRPLSPLERVLWRFRMAAHEAQTMWRGFNRVQDVARDINDDLLFGLTNQALIIVTKYLEVWDDLGRLAKTDPRVVGARRVGQAAVDRMELWPGIRAFRNTSLAHAYLDKSGHLVPPWALIRSGCVPTFHAEIILLLQLAVFGSLAVLIIFEKEYLAIETIAHDSAQWEPVAGPGISLGTEIEGEVRRVTSDMNRRLMSEFGIVAKGPLLETFKRVLNPIQ